LLLLNTDGQVEPYTGARDPQAIFSWLSEELGTDELLADRLDSFLMEIDESLDTTDFAAVVEVADDNDVFHATPEAGDDVFQISSSEYEFVSEFS